MSGVYEQLADTVEFYGQVKVLRFTPGAGSHFDRLGEMRLHIGTMDLRIASIALAYGGVVVTRNIRDFQRVPELALEDWAQSG